jgi:hypothetical protein
MAEEKKEIEKEKDPMEQDYLEQIEKLKENSVDKSQYNKLLEENRKLLNSIVKGQPLQQEQPKETVDVKKLRKELFSEDTNLSNLQYWEKALQLREAVMEKGGRDPFLPYGHHISPDSNDIQKVDNLVKVVKECIDYAKGDSRVFTIELDRRTNEAMPVIRGR